MSFVSSQSHQIRAHARCPKMVLHPDIARAKIDTCYLDTTYLNPKYCFPPQPQVIEACAILARKVAMGISDSAPKLDELKPEAKVDTRFDAKPDVNAVKQELEEKERGIMRGWLVSRDSGDDVKLEEGEEVKLEDRGVKAENGEEDKLRSVNDLMIPKPVVKVKPKARTLIVMGTYSIGKERIVKGELLVTRGISWALTDSGRESTRDEDLLRPAEAGDLAVSDRS